VTIALDIAGRRFGRLTVVARVANHTLGYIRWLCLCDCGNQVVARGSKLKDGRTHGCSNCVKPGYKPTPAAERFWPKVRWQAAPAALDVLGRPIVGECAIWTGALDKAGYAVEFWVLGHNGRTTPYRWAYEHYIGPIPEGLIPDHLCRVPACVSFFHIEPVTNKENLRRGNGWCGRHARQTHCKYGHSLDGAYIIKDGSRKGGRVCRTCAMRRSIEKSAARTHCQNGHNLADAIVGRDGQRRCLACLQQSVTRIAEKRRALKRLQRVFVNSLDLQEIKQ
jgi:hypothetical protein